MNHVSSLPYLKRSKIGQVWTRYILSEGIYITFTSGYSASYFLIEGARAVGAVTVLVIVVKGKWAEGKE